MELLLIVGAVLALIYFLHVRVIKLRNRTLEALSGIDVQIKKRANLIPNVLTIAKKFMEHERSLLEDITAARAAFENGYNAQNADDVKAHLQAADSLQAGLGKLMAIAENYPDLKSDTVMLEAQKTYQDVEANISAARRFYNAAVTDLNNAVQIFPSSVIASMVGIGQMPFYELDEAARNTSVNAADLL